MSKNKDGFESGKRVSDSALFAHLAKQRQAAKAPEKKPSRAKKAD